MLIGNLIPRGQAGGALAFIYLVFGILSFIRMNTRKLPCGNSAGGGLGKKCKGAVAAPTLVIDRPALVDS